METENQKKEIQILVFDYIRDLFQIKLGTDQKGTIEYITSAAEFKGISVWTLIFAIFIASIGLNTNSTAVIIGAMLISPLMGPIMGIGLSLGIYDFDLLKKSFRNFLVMTVISICTSTLYFFISPLTEADSELLARTYPTIYDVLIALFGGLTGIVASSRKNRMSNAIPGVAIATALMPPLCTAGFGIANGNPKYFAGALYLYIINSVFICVSTWFIVSYLGFRSVEYVNQETKKRIQKYIYIISFTIIIPSIYMAYDVISQSNFRKNANQFIQSNFNLPKTKILTTNIVRNPRNKSIDVTLIGEPISEELIGHIKSKLSQYGLEDVELNIIQNSDSEKLSKAMNVNRNEVLDNLKTKDEKIRYLEAELSNMKDTEKMIPKVAKEINILFPEIESISFGDLLVQSTDNFSNQKSVSILIKWKNKVADIQIKRVELYLKSRLNLEDLTVHNEF
ncbi:DUF389 domain-containing protein [Leptospira sp. GIMC2001]|uniref:DUF389 domain-containing protein n=1 Tax=Leptospira sp. GIMC2001 TaxID=1513297 RepID=UPI00234B8B54|nr:DUF389 domain-containing protein [Leptospira sp. GIMC2001]WCL49148.1 DUF389 domain-containing protein [Leptospira sp. GIMC2001]